MFNRFGTKTVELNREAYGGADVESYLTELITDFSRARSMMQQEADKPEPTEAPDPEDSVIRRLQESLEKAKSESEEFSRRLGEAEREKSRSAEELKNLLSEKEKVEEKNRELRAEHEDALNRIKTLTQEKEDALQGENDAIQKYLDQLQENSDLASELFSLRFSGEKASEVDPEQTEEQETVFDEASDGEDYSTKFGEELTTESGKELFMMLRGLLQDNARDDNGMRVTKAWEEEVEETIPGAFPDEPAIIRKVRTRSEVSVEYMAGHKNEL